MKGRKKEKKEFLNQKEIVVAMIGLRRIYISGDSDGYIVSQTIFGNRL